MGRGGRVILAGVVQLVVGQVSPGELSELFRRQRPDPLLVVIERRRKVHHLVLAAANLGHPAALPVGRRLVRGTLLQASLFPGRRVRASGPDELHGELHRWLVAIEAADSGRRNAHFG